MGKWKFNIRKAINAIDLNENYEIIVLENHKRKREFEYTKNSTWYSTGWYHR